MTTHDLSSGRTGSLETLLDRMHRNPDFPAISGVITEINRIASSESGSNEQLTNAILQDVGVSSKLIKLVNSAQYRQFGQHISTVSRAVTILGFETVRDIAAALFLLDFLKNKAQAAELKEGIVLSILSGYISTELSPPEYQGHEEEKIISTMFYHLGKLLASFYFFDECQLIANLQKTATMNDEQAEIKILGQSYSALGIGVVKGWGFPQSVIAGMRRLPEGIIAKPRSAPDYLCATVNLSNELCQVVASISYQDKDLALKKLCDRYRNVNKVSESILLNALEHGLEQLMNRAEIFEINVSESAVVRNAMIWLMSNELDD